MVMSAVHALFATMMVGVSTANAIRGSPKPAQKIAGIRHKGRVRDDDDDIGAHFHVSNAKRARLVC